MLIRIEVVARPGYKVSKLIYADTKSGKYAKPFGLSLAKGQAPFDSAGVMTKPGFITMSTKDDTIRRPGFILPEPFTAPVLN